MVITSIDGKRFAEMVIQGANRLSANAKYVDALNVFPVPDGDTGTNMNLSMTSGANEVRNNVQDHIGKVGSSLAKGLLMGARGNSGVILSQLFRGFAKNIEAKSTINSKEFAQAFEAGVETAYKAVMKPVEGTILTVAKDAAKAGVSAAEKEESITGVMEAVLAEAKASLKRTPDLLPVLKEVGVVDSGGQGLVFVYEGFLAELKGEKLPETPESKPKMDELVSAEHHMNVQGHMKTEDIEFGYCTEFMVRFEPEKTAENPFNEEQFRQDLSEFGDSLLVISDDDIVKVHIHAENPGNCLNYGQKYGSLIKIKIENMREQHSTILNETDNQLRENTAAVQTEKKPFGVVAIAMGEGIADLFRSIGTDVVIEGGQTMNPSTEDIVKAVEAINADHVYILPNNKNIIMAANQASDVSDKAVTVIPSKTIPQGLTALLTFNPTATAEENEELMNEALQNVVTGQITFAVRDTSIEGLEIEKDDYMGLIDGKIKVKNKDRVEAAKEVLSSMLDNAEILTILYGEEASEEEVDALVDYCSEKYPDIEVEVHNGKQPLYSYIFAAE
ncbi:DAK2 domain-containing protein [Pradoshia sp.]